MTLRVRPAACIVALILALAPGSAAADPAAPADSTRIAGIRESLEAGDSVSAREQASALLEEEAARHGRRSLAVAEVIHALLATYSRPQTGGDEPIALAEEALAIRQELFPEGALELAIAYSDLGMGLTERGEYERAIELLRVSAAIREEHLAPNDPELARTYQDLGYALYNAREYHEVVVYSERAVAVMRAADPVDRQLLGRSLFNQSAIQMALGDYEGAEPVLEEAYEILRVEWGVDDPQYAMVQLNLAFLKGRLGHQSEALRIVEETRLGLEPGPGETPSPSLASALMFEASLRSDLGDKATARDLGERAVEVTEELYGPDHPQLAEALRLLGGLELSLGNYDEVGPPLERSLEIAVATFGEDHEFVANVRRNLGHLELYTGDLDLAREHATAARDIYATTTHERHPLVGTASRLLALVEMEAGNPSAALAHTELALEIQNEVAPDNGNLANLQAQRAVALYWLGETEEAREEALRASATTRRAVREQVRLLTEDEALPLRTPRGDVDLVLTLVEGAPSPEIEDAWDIVIRDRGLLLDEMAYRARLTRSATDPEIAELLSRLQEGRRELARLQSGDGSGAAVAQREEAEAEIAEAETELAVRSAVFRARSEAETIGFDAVAAALQPGQALVAYVRYLGQDWSEDALATPTEPPRSDLPIGGRTSPRYLAFVLRGGSAPAEAVSLGSAVELEAAVHAWRRAVKGGGGHREPGAALRERVWDPVADRVAGSELVLVVPDGALHLVNFAALPDREREPMFLLDTAPTFHGLSAERDLVDPGMASGRGLLAVGGVDYDAVGAVQLAVADELATPNAFRSLPECGSFGAVRFARLPGSRREIEKIGDVWRSSAGQGKPLLLRDGKATESELLRAVAGKRVLHLATHGFFLDADCVAGTGGETRGVVKVTSVEGDDDAAILDAEASPTNRPSATESLLLSGLALSGANLRADARPGGDDGILTGLEIGALDLSGAEWVVLSACDTGLGRFAAGEGLFGLRRAFGVAGARTLIVSLWSVGDEDASEWMQALYAARFRDGLSTAEAMRAASRARLAALRSKGRYPDPRAWAPFVATGRWE